jgi:hypothetical protein
MRKLVAYTLSVMPYHHELRGLQLGRLIMADWISVSDNLAEWDIARADPGASYNLVAAAVQEHATTH